MVKTIPITKAGGNLGEVVKRMHLDKDSLVLEKGGILMAAIVDIDEFEDWLETKDRELKNQIRQGHKEYKKGKAVALEKFLARIQAKKK